MPTELLLKHLVTLFLILLFSILLLSRRSFRDMDARYFWLTVLSCLILVFEDILETMAAEEPSLLYWRITLSIIGYLFRSVSAIGLLLVIVPQRLRRPALWIPCIIVLLVNLTAYFSKVAFWYNETYDFRRGPLGYVSFIVPAIYLLLIIWISFRRIAERSGAERFIVPAGALFCMAAAISDALYGGCRLNEAIIICTTFFYIFLYSHDNRRDPLTRLLNRQAFYDDCAIQDRNVGAVASLDMNGLKKLNDSMGHKAGDEALISIGACLNSITDRKTLAYRVGGDEFIVLFLHDLEDKVKEATAQVVESVNKAGYSISAGYAMRDRSRDLDDTVKESDSLMYADKARYYLESGEDRREN